ncbi:MAG: UDP-N-acetylglucosamine 2-epimerase (non-hydrolyzing) [bacterium]|nr:UDP-N-acetylglucosamine 2-epimerase (non-hydrolyzing) [bacterium]
MSKRPKVVVIIGARPQFIKHFPLQEALIKAKVSSYVVHTGQHYDKNMSDVFFDELGIAKADINLMVGSGSHGEQTGNMLTQIEKVLLQQQPDMVIVYGDTNSTIAGSLAASKLHIPIAHIEAGLRSYNKKMPEEINRVLTDHISDLLFIPSEPSRNNLGKEGITEGVINVGDIMYDSVQLTMQKADSKSSLKKYGLSAEKYYFATIHRPHNTDSKQRLQSILNAFDNLPLPVLFPAHPRTRKKMKEYGLISGDNVILADPLGYKDTIALLSKAKCVITDSGGLQKEAYYVKSRCVTIRQETEWTETLYGGWNCLVDAETSEIVNKVSEETELHDYVELYGGGDSAEKIVEHIIKYLSL